MYYAVYNIPFLIFPRKKGKKCNKEKNCIAIHRQIITSEIWALSPENLSSGFPSKRDSNQSPQQQRQSRKLNFTSSLLTHEIFQKANNKDADQTARMRRLVCLRLCCSQAPESRFSRDETHMSLLKILKLAITNKSRSGKNHMRYDMTKPTK